MPVAAAAAADGLISDEHIARILDTITDLPPGLHVEDRDAADQILTDIAQHGTPRDVAAAGARLLDTVNPDGQQPDDGDQPSRGLTLHRRRDGSYQLSGRLTGECGVQTEAVLNAYAAPRPTVNIDNGVSVPDQRTPAQRQHDALHDLTSLALHADTLQHTGRRAELIITTTAAETCSSPEPTEDADAFDADSDKDFDSHGDVDSDKDFDSAEGDSDGRALDAAPVDAAPLEAEPVDAAPADDLHARLQRALLRLNHHAWTSTGNRLTTPAALRLCDTALIAVVTVGPDGRILNYGQTRRFATKAQLRTLIGRDLGCSFPGCDHPPQWCEIHHVVQWADGGPTDLENLTLVCGYHHRGFARMGWTCQINNGIPYWTPPKHIDPAQKPMRNHAHLLR